MDGVIGAGQLSSADSIRASSTEFRSKRRDKQKNTNEPLRVENRAVEPSPDR